jgi:hypothetical protein
MIARVATFESLPDDLDPDAVDLLRRTVRSVPGYVAGFHLRDPGSGRSMSIVVFSDEAAIARLGAALGSRPEERRVGIDPDRVEFFEAAAF